jgi:hypothetical protein
VLALITCGDAAGSYFKKDQRGRERTVRATASVPVTGTLLTAAAGFFSRRTTVLTRKARAEAPMGLSDIAAGLEVTAEQRDRGVATADGTGASLADRLAAFEDDLPCGPAAAAALVEAYAGGASVGRAAAVADVPRTTAAKTLYLLGEPVDPLTPTARRVLADWLAGEIPRSEARRLADVGDCEFALGTYVATHDPIDGAESVVADALSPTLEADPLSDAVGDADDWF